jgi:hypothetical protein
MLSRVGFDTQNLDRAWQRVCLLIHEIALLWGRTARLSREPARIVEA